MFLLRFRILIVTCLALGFSCSSAQASYKKSEIHFEVSTGQTVFARSQNLRVYPASLTKLMTAYIILRSNRPLSDQAIISKKAWARRFGNSSIMFLEPNMSVTVDELLKGLLIQSGNDAAVALAELHSGSEDAFVQEMNKTAKELGMNNTNFANPHGRHHKNHYTTADDFRKLVISIIRDTPQITRYTREESFEFNNILQYNRNESLKLDNSIGLKTGFTPQSGYNLASCFEINGGTFCSVTFGDPTPTSRSEHAKRIYEKFSKHHYVSESPKKTITIMINGETRTVDIFGERKEILRCNETLEHSVSISELDNELKIVPAEKVVVSSNNHCEDR